MQIDYFSQIIVPVIGGLGIFMLGLEFMSNGIQALAVNKMRAFLAKVAGTPITGLAAGTVITGVIQSSTAMTVMVVGLVNAGVMTLRPAISVIMGANIGTTLGNGLIALPLGPLGLLLAGFFALVYCFSKSDKVRNISLACMGFALIFYGLSMMTGGLRPLRNIPEVMSVISTLKADNYLSLIYCVLTAAAITAFIHSSSATIGIVMGLGAAGVLDWQTAVAFSLGADLGTTITSWMASLNLSKNAKRAAYAHISFNIIGVAVMLPFFFLSMQLLTFVMGWFGGDPGVPIVGADGKETFPLVPVAVGLYSTFFNVFNTALMFPFIGVFDRVLSRVGRDAAEDVEDYSTPRYLDARNRANIALAAPTVQKEIARNVEAAGVFLASARGVPTAPKDVKEHAMSADILSRDIRAYASALFEHARTYEEANLIASLIEEADFTASLSETLHQVARRVMREEFTVPGRTLVNEMLEKIDDAIRGITGVTVTQVTADMTAARIADCTALRERALKLEVPPVERGSILALLGSAERSYGLIERIDTERRSVMRMATAAQPAEALRSAPEAPGAAMPVPA
jgi:phosphate:Na+ symporter